jgi:hypothetical protein
VLSSVIIIFFLTQCTLDALSRKKSMRTVKKFRNSNLQYYIMADNVWLLATLSFVSFIMLKSFILKIQVLLLFLLRTYLCKKTLSKPFSKINDQSSCHSQMLINVQSSSAILMTDFHITLCSYYNILHCDL